MSQAHEALTKRLQRLDKWISETERVATLARDAETRQQIANDLTRWRQSRRECAAFLARMKWLNRAVSTMIALVVVSFAAMFVFAFFATPQSGFVSVLLAIDYLVLFSSTIGYVAVIALRDAVALGRKPWQFSLARVLSVMTGIAIALGALAWLTRR